jgi:hypothetical protein
LNENLKTTEIDPKNCSINFFNRYIIIEKLHINKRQTKNKLGRYPFSMVKPILLIRFMFRKIYEPKRFNKSNQHWNSKGLKKCCHLNWFSQKFHATVFFHTPSVPLVLFIYVYINSKTLAKEPNLLEIV